MPVQIDAVLLEKRPRPICISCLASITSRDEDDVRDAVMTLLMERRAETSTGECMNCGAMAFVVRRR